MSSIRSGSGAAVPRDTGQPHGSGPVPPGHTAVPRSRGCTARWRPRPLPDPRRPPNWHRNRRGSPYFGAVHRIGHERRRHRPGACPAGRLAGAGSSGWSGTLTRGRLPPPGIGRCPGHPLELHSCLLQVHERLPGYPGPDTGGSRPGPRLTDLPLQVVHCLAELTRGPEHVLRSLQEVIHLLPLTGRTSHCRTGGSRFLLPGVSIPIPEARSQAVCQIVDLPGQVVQ